MSLRIKENVNPSLIIILSVILIISSSITITANNNNFFGTNFVIAYSNLNQTRSNHLTKSSIDILQNVPAKKVHVGDIDIAYKTLGKGKPIILIGGVPLVMDAWPPSMLQELSSNHTVIIFDNTGVGNTTSGTKPFSKLSIPTLVITGTEDVSVPSANSLIIVQKIPGAWLVQIKGAGHGFFQSLIIHKRGSRSMPAV